VQVLFRKACEELLRRLENDNGLRFPSRTKRLPAGYFERCLFKSHGKFPLDSADHERAAATSAHEARARDGRTRPANVISGKPESESCCALGPSQFRC